jgi:hypothetical protein
MRRTSARLTCAPRLAITSARSDLIPAGRGAQLNGTRTDASDMHSPSTPTLQLTRSSTAQVRPLLPTRVDNVATPGPATHVQQCSLGRRTAAALLALA